MAESIPPLEFRKVSRRYRSGSVPAVADVDLAVAPGEILALIGGSGSGKTTLLRLAAGLESPDGGEVRLDGVLVAGGGIARELPPEQRHLGLVFQEGALFPHLTAAANIAYGLRGRHRAAVRERVEECLALVALPGYGDRYPHELSGGERQRIALARALAPAPRLLLLDEPFSHLDPALRWRLREEIRDILAGLGQTALLVTHDPDDVFAMATRVAVLERGEIGQCGLAAEVYRHPVNRYCAECLGPANRVVDPAGGKERWTRPEDFLPSEIHRDQDEAIVESVRVSGARIELRLAPIRQPDDRWLAHWPDQASALPPRAGDRIPVAWRA
jgi:iron(III) transport system ATP-binding protein